MATVVFGKDNSPCLRGRLRDLGNQLTTEQGFGTMYNCSELPIRLLLIGCQAASPQLRLHGAFWWPMSGHFPAVLAQRQHIIRLRVS